MRTALTPVSTPWLQSLEKHRKICKKVFQTKRKAFDMRGARIGEALAEQSKDGAPTLSSEMSVGEEGAEGGDAGRGGGRDENVLWVAKGGVKRRSGRHSPKLCAKR